LNCALSLTNGDIEFAKQNDFIDFAIPPLIDITPIERNVVENTCLLYLRDQDYCNLVDQLVANNPNMQFTVFTNHVDFIQPKQNVHLHKPGPAFKEFLKTTQVLIASSGVESICEALFNRIPIIVFQPDIGDEEQTYNYNFYIRKQIALPFSPNMDLSSVKSIYKKTDWFIEYCLSADKRINKIIDIAMNK
jgi:hypothetical protein